MTTKEGTVALSQEGKARLLKTRGEPLFLANWDRAVFIHYEADPVLLQRQVAFELDLRKNRAFVSVVAFTLSGLRLRFGGRVGKWILRPIASHEFLNVRTYVRHHGEPGIFFLAEWLPNSLSVCLGPRTFGLPYRLGRLTYSHTHEVGEMRGEVATKEGRLAYHAMLPDASFAPSERDSMTEFLLERYTAFTYQHHRRRLFRVWHKPWQQTAITAEVTSDDLLARTGEWWQSAEFAGANYSPGVCVWMGRPHQMAGFDFIGSLF